MTTKTWQLAYLGGTEIPIGAPVEGPDGVHDAARPVVGVQLKENENGEMKHT